MNGLQQEYGEAIRSHLDAGTTSAGSLAGTGAWA
jgi:hypothetical protein